MRSPALLYPGVESLLPRTPFTSLDLPRVGLKAEHTSEHRLDLQEPLPVRLGKSDARVSGAAIWELAQDSRRDRRSRRG